MRVRTDPLSLVVGQADFALKGPDGTSVTLAQMPVGDYQSRIGGPAPSCRAFARDAKQSTNPAGSVCVHYCRTYYHHHESCSHGGREIVEDMCYETTS
jgi:hypothetical protein